MNWPLKQASASRWRKLQNAPCRASWTFSKASARVALLKGMDASVLPKIAERLTITEGAERLISTLKSLGYRTAILSGGFQYFAEYLQEKLGLDEVHANVLDVQDGVVTGEVKGHIVDGARKALLLTHIAEEMGISLEQAIAVGDGANDLPMLSIAGLGVAFRAKPLVRQNANQAISSVGLTVCCTYWACTTKT